MGLFGKLKDAVGIGSLKVEVVLDRPGLHPGDEISGNVVLSDAASDTKITSVLFQLVNFGIDIETTDVVTEDHYSGTQWDSYQKKFKHQTVLFETYLAQAFTIVKGQRLELPISITTPPDMLPSDKQNRYVLKVHVDIPGQIDSKVGKPLHIMTGGGSSEPMMAGPGMDSSGPADGGDLPTPGERVLAYYEDAYYECTVLAADPAGAQVQWGDGTDSVVSMDVVLPSESAMPSPADLTVGQRVMARFDEGFFEAAVGAVEGDQVGVRWDDGGESFVSLSDVRLL